VITASSNYWLIGTFFVTVHKCCCHGSTV